MPPDDPAHGPDPLRRKQPGIVARFVIMFAKDTLEDPTPNAVQRDGFLDEIERISEASGGLRRRVDFDALDTFLVAPGPDVVPEPERLERYERRGRPRWRAGVRVSGRATRSTTLAECAGRRGRVRVPRVRRAAIVGRVGAVLAG